MNKTYKKSNITNYINIKNLKESTQEEEINELVDSNGTMISRNNNYVQNRSHIKSKKTTDDFVRNSTQGPEAYFIYGGPYYGINYTYVVNEEEILSEEDDMYDELNVVQDKSDLDSGRKLADRDIKKYYNKPAQPFYDDLPSEDWRKHSLPYDTKFDIDLTESDETIRNMVDEIVRSKRDVKGMVKKTNEQDVLGDKFTIPDIMELKDVHEKPMVIRKINSLMDLIEKENLQGNELSILLNHIINNIDVDSMDEKERELLGDKLKYGSEEK